MNLKALGITICIITMIMCYATPVLYEYIRSEEESASSESSGVSYIEQNNINVGGDVIVNIAENAAVGSPASVCETIRFAAKVLVKNTLELDGMETTYGISIVMADNPYVLTLPESQYLEYVNTEDSTLDVVVERLTVQNGPSNKGVFERYSFPWEQDSKEFSEEEISELKNIFDTDDTSSIEEIKDKFILNYCKIGEQEIGS